jgi:hypothetical protein
MRMARRKSPNSPSFPELPRHCQSGVLNSLDVGVTHRSSHRPNRIEDGVIALEDCVEGVRFDSLGRSLSQYFESTRAPVPYGIRV